MKKNFQYDIACVGNLVGSDMLFAESLSKKGLKCCVLHHKESIKDKYIKIFNYYHCHVKDKDIIYYNSSWEFIKLVKKSRLILCFGGALIGALREFWFIRHYLQLPPIVNWTTGSDIMELAVSKTFRGFLYRQYLDYVDLNVCATYPQSLKNVIDLKIPNVVFLPNPCYLYPTLTETKNNNDPTRALTFFHPSHLDWKVTDSNPKRVSTKGNDRFIKAFGRAVKNGLNAVCVILDRGSDRDVAKKLISDLQIEKYFVWKNHMTREQLFNQYLAADVVVDQFDVGGFGTIALEAMSVGKPVMIYLNSNCQKLLHHELPPVLNCYTEEEIYQQIMACQDRKALLEIGRKAKEWVYKYHHWENCFDQFLFYYTYLTGHKVVDYGWELDPYRNF